MARSKVWLNHGLKMNLHINHIVVVRLTQKGAQVYNDFHAHLPADHWTRKGLDDIVTEPLWQIMRIFGAHMGTPENLFTPNVIEI